MFLSPNARGSPTLLPGIHVRAYPVSPTRDDRVGEARLAAQDRADKAYKQAVDDRRKRKLLVKLSSILGTEEMKKHTCAVEAS